MAILEDKQILAYCRHNDEASLIYPFHESLLQPCSYDVCLGEVYMTERLWPFRPVDPWDKKWRERRASNGKIVVWPKQLILASTIERVRLTGRVCARVTGRSTLGRSGIAVHATADHVDPGYRGNLTLQIHNLGWTPIVLRVGMPIAQVIFAQTEFVPRATYGSPGLGSAYQDQSGPAVAARV